MNKPLAGPVAPLAAAELCRRCAPERFEFSTTAELPDLEEVVGQPRALGAIEFGVGIRREGYNLFAMGPEGVGRHTIVRRHLEQQAKRLEAPSDWCYVLNFDTPHRPRALRLHAGAAPAFKDKVMSPEEFHALPEAEQKRLEELISGLQEELERAIHELPKVRREALRRMRELNRQVTRAAVDSLIEDLKAEYRDTPQVQTYLAGVQNDVLDHAEVFRQPKDGEPTEVALRRYQVNVLMEHAGAQGAPIVYEDHPSHDALVGRIEHIAQMGALVTDFTLIKAGALHRANGGYLILDALKVLTQPFAWEALKRV